MIKYEQFIENYRDDYKKYRGWSIIKNDYYIFHYFKGCLREKDLNLIISTQTKSYKKICDSLDISSSKIIKYYIYPDQDEKEKLMGNRVYGQSVYADNSIHIVFNNKVRPIGSHEDTHLLSLKYGLATSFFAEGLAESIDHKTTFMGKSRKEWLKNYHKTYKETDISAFFAQQAWLDTPDEMSSEFYTIAMFYVSFLIKNFGKENFLRFYKKMNRGMDKGQIISTLENIFKDNYQNINIKWLKLINSKKQN
jgi:hypothetical protein